MSLSKTNLPIDPAMVSTTDTIAGYRIAQTFGVAEGFAVVLYPAITPNGQKEALVATVREAFLDLIRCAAAQGANAIVGLRYHQPSGSETIGRNIIAYGTAVKAAKMPYSAE
jgi:uncharacterized protein YbjQ (UPF0145 family)